MLSRKVTLGNFRFHSKSLEKKNPEVLGSGEGRAYLETQLM